MKISLNNKIVIVVLSIATIILFIQMLSHSENNDFTSFIISSKALINGTNPYDTGSAFPYIYPLTLAFFLIPFTILPVISLQIGWFILNVFFIYKSYIWTLDLYEGTKGVTYIFTIFIAILSFNIIQNNLLNGQSNLLILYLCFLFHINFCKNKFLLAGLFLAISISVKLISFLLILYFIVRKKFFYTAFTIFLAIFLILLPYVVSGEKLIEYYKYYTENFLLSKISFNSKSEFNSGMFFSLVGLLNYTLPKIAQGIMPISICFLIINLFYLMVEKKLDKMYPKVIFALYLVGFLLISPMSETHHLLYLLPLIILLLKKTWYNHFQYDSIKYFLTFIILILLFGGKYYHLLYFLITFPLVCKFQIRICRRSPIALI